MKITGAPSVLAKLAAAWKSPSLEAPSPKYATAQAFFLSSCRQGAPLMRQQVQGCVQGSAGRGPCVW